MTKVVKTDGVLPAKPKHLAELAALDADYFEETCLTEEALIETCADADALLVLREPVSARVIASLKSCRVISRFGIGVDTVDVAAATAAGIAVANVPDASTDEVSTHAVAMILYHLRRLQPLDAHVRANAGGSAIGVGRGITRTGLLRVGLLGLGNIGRLTARKLAPFGFRLQVYDPYVGDAQLAEVGAVRVDLDTLLTTSDVLSLHVPLTDQTNAIVDRAALARMKPGAIIVNVSRGRLIDEPALAEALASGHIAAAALDTFAREPLPGDSPLRASPNTLLTPHMAHYSDQSLAELIDKAFANVTAVLRGGRAPYQIN